MKANFAVVAAILASIVAAIPGPDANGLAGQKRSPEAEPRFNEWREVGEVGGEKVKRAAEAEAEAEPRWRWVGQAGGEKVKRAAEPEAEPRWNPWRNRGEAGGE